MTLGLYALLSHEIYELINQLDGTEVSFVQLIDFFQSCTDYPNMGLIPIDNHVIQYNSHDTWYPFVQLLNFSEVAQTDDWLVHL